MTKPLYQIRERCPNCGMIGTLFVPWGETIQGYMIRTGMVCESCGCRMDGSKTCGERLPVPDPDLVAWSV